MRTLSLSIQIDLIPGSSYIEITKINYFVCVPVLASTEVFGCKISIEWLLVRQNRLKPFKSNGNFKYLKIDLSRAAYNFFKRITQK